MDLQNKLIEVTRFLLRLKFDDCHVYIYQPSSLSLGVYCIVVTVRELGNEYKGSSTGRNIFEVYLKALCEVGEEIIKVRECLNNRNGLAGGLLKSNVISRAKAELIERDAFLYHYKNLLPFKKISSPNLEILSFQLSSIDSEYSVFLVMNEDYLASSSSCLKLGLGCHKNPRVAFERAYNEYAAMVLDHHIKEPCSIRRDLKVSNAVEFHHMQSFSKENKFIFEILCNGKGNVRRNYNYLDWRATSYNSPIRLFKFYKVDHPELIRMEFGSADFFESLGQSAYHPFW